ncbi:hypothetical protein CHARACLAT_009195 [Characodon lateralis]|uniref:Uncharacterized protein n=1 Tax=Characodon lateralis TaxID=208331 RepID=A0ABU7EHL7_9TELE|nr:hypothetical protein [Characodon lateralis]
MQQHLGKGGRCKGQATPPPHQKTFRRSSDSRARIKCSVVLQKACKIVNLFFAVGMGRQPPIDCIYIKKIENLFNLCFVFYVGLVRPTLFFCKAALGNRPYQIAGEYPVQAA